MREFKRSVCYVLGEKEKEKESKEMRPAKENEDILKMSGEEQMEYVGSLGLKHLIAFPFYLYVCVCVCVCVCACVY